jgi:Domain of unknown function (DUF6798)
MIADHKSHPWLAICLCLLGGLAVGLSGFSSDSNHPTYLPPALQYLDATYLEADWWLNSSRHYHLAYFALCSALSALGYLELGLAVLNVAVVSGLLYASFKIIKGIWAEGAVASLVVFIAIFLMTRSFSSIGASYLFTPSLQPSSIAATASLFALASFADRRFLRSGVWLTVAGLFHLNFLLVNLLLFSTTYLVLKAPEALREPTTIWTLLRGLLALTAPSIVLLGMFTPLLLSLQHEDLTLLQKAEADRIFFHFAVPFHYLPAHFIDKLLPFLGWQLAGLLWTRYAVVDPAQRRLAWALQLSFGILIWLATLLTTMIFVPSVSRLFIWRLAPFSVLFATIMIIVGMLRAERKDGPASSGLRDWHVIAATILLLPFLTAPATVLAGQIVPSGGIWPAGLVVGALLIGVCLRWTVGAERAPRPWIAGLAFSTLLGAAFLTQPSDGRQSRYSLLFRSSVQAEEEALFRFVQGATPGDANFAIPPDLDYFRLRAGRAAVVDLKAMPMNGAGILEWYNRLSAVSGVRQPGSHEDVNAGYGALDANRAEYLRKQYGISYIILRAGHDPDLGDWREVFSSRSFSVFVHASEMGPSPRVSHQISQRAPSRLGAADHGRANAQH